LKESIHGGIKKFTGVVLRDLGDALVVLYLLLVFQWSLEGVFQGKLNSIKTMEGKMYLY